MKIESEEFAGRRARAAASVAAAGLDGLLVCSRGGGALDRYGDVLYLTNFYSSFPYIPDQPGHWTARAHPFVVLSAAGDAVLVADLPYLDDVAMPPDSVVVTDTVIESVVEQVRALGLDAGRIGLAGDDVLSAAHDRALRAALPAAEIVEADSILARLRAVKSPGEIALLTEAAQIGSRTVEAMLDAALPGATHGDVVAAGMQVLVPRGGVLYNSFMASGTGGENPTAHRSRFPTWANPEPLAEGQWLRLGISGVLDGYVFDVSRSKAIGKATNRQIDAFEAAIAVIETGIEAVRAGATAGDVAQAGNARQRELGYPLDGVFTGLGHGIGMGWDLPWLTPDDPTPLEENMVINLEKTLANDGYLGDFEETVVITASGPRLLTDARKRTW